MSIIEVKNLKKSFGSNEVLKDINVSIAEKEVVCVIGPSGSGKSTFLRCLNRLEEITGGTVIVDDFDITSPKVDINKVREEVGMVFQHFNLFPHKTVLENVTLAPIKVRKSDKEQAKQRALELLDKVGLREKADNYPGELSGGQKQRVAIARALLHHPQWILADEPTGNLDSVTGDAIFELLLELHREAKCGVLFVTHDLELAERADRILFMQDGRIVEDRRKRTVQSV